MKKKPGTTYPEHGKPQRLEGKGIEFGGGGKAERRFHSKIITTKGFS